MPIFLDRKISFIHVADLHLDSPFKGLAHVPERIFKDIRESTFHAFDYLVNCAIENEVDFILLVGDLFDNEKQSLKAQVHLRSGFQKLNEYDIKVYLSYGNHDYIKGNIHPITYPDNVHIFSSEEVSSFVFEKDGQSLAKIYGFSYEDRAVLGNKTEEYYRIEDHIPFHIGMLHGSVYGNQTHDPYAPFTLTNLKEKSFDYWALGHIHKREVLHENPPIVYSGNTQGRHRNEQGEKGCYIVSLSDQNISLDFIPLQTILFDNVSIDLTNCQSIHDVEPLIYTAIAKKESAQLIYVSFIGHSERLFEWEESYLIAELIDIVNESLLSNQPWSFIYRYEIKHDYNEQVIETNDYFLNEFVSSIEQLEVRSVMNQLLNHRDSHF